MSDGPSVTGSRTLVDVLAAAGVQRVYGVPGEHCLELVDDIAATPGLSFVAARHEGGAAFMAEAEAKLTGVPGVCLGTAAVGAANLSIGIHTARQDSTPLIALIGQVSTTWRHREAWQEVDLAATFAPQSKWAIELTNPDRIGELTQRAVVTALSGRCGPVVLAVPDDVQRAAARPTAPATMAPPRAQLSATDATKIVEQLTAGHRPVLLLGGGLAGGIAHDDLVTLVDATGAEVVAAFRRPDVFPNDHPRYVGGSGLGAVDAVEDALTSADLILAIGTRLSELTTLRYSLPRPEQTLIHLDASPEVLSSGVRMPDLAIVADPRDAAAALARHAGQAGLGGSGRHAPRAAEPSVAGGATATVAAAVNEWLPQDGVVTSDAGDFYPPFARAIVYRDRRRYLGPTSGAMGYALPAAIAASLATDGRRQVVGLAGDGGFMMSLPELETAVRLNAKLVMVVVNNDRYGSIRRHQDTSYGGRFVGVDLQNPSFAEVARTFGARGERLEHPEQMADLLATAGTSDGPTIIEYCPES